MIIQYLKDIVTPELEKGALYNDEFHGFHDDYLVLHCLLRIYKPKSVLEIGTNMGTGTQIIKNAVPEADVYSLDLPTELAHISLQSPISEGKGDRVGSNCHLPFTLLRADSRIFDYSQYPCEAYFVDGEHTWGNVHSETSAILQLNPKLIIYHDSDIPEVYNAILAASIHRRDYTLYRVIDTRISYLLKNQ